MGTKIGGPGGFSADAIKVFSNINGTLFVATLALVFVLLILIYRSPIFWMIPLMGVAQFSVFAGFSIYLPELFGARSRGTGVSGVAPGGIRAA